MWLDRWWARRERRLDRTPMNVFVMLGLMSPALSIILRGPSPISSVADMPDITQIAMCACIFVGLGTCLHGAVMRSRWWFPKASLIRCYRKGMSGGPIAVAGLWVYTYFLYVNTVSVWGTLNAFLTPALSLGVASNCLWYALEIRLIRRRKAEFTQRALIKAQIEHEDECSDDS